MDWSAIFAGIAALTSIFGFVYSVRQHRDNIRKEFVLWALQEWQNPTQRDARAFIYFLNRIESMEKKKELVEGIKNGESKILYGKQFSNMRGVFNLCNHIGYFWVNLHYGNMTDAKALFPHLVNVWNLSEQYIKALRSRPYQQDSFIYFEKIVMKLKKAK